MLATMPQSVNSAVLMLNPTTEFTVQIILFKNHEFNNELYIIHYTQQMSILTCELTTVFTVYVVLNPNMCESNTITVHWAIER